MVMTIMVKYDELKFVKCCFIFKGLYAVEKRRVKEKMKFLRERQRRNIRRLFLGTIQTNLEGNVNSDTDSQSGNVDDGNSEMFIFDDDVDDISDIDIENAYVSSSIHAASSTSNYVNGIPLSPFSSLLHFSQEHLFRGYVGYQCNHRFRWIFGAGDVPSIDTANSNAVDWIVDDYNDCVLEESVSSFRDEIFGRAAYGDPIGALGGVILDEDMDDHATGDNWLIDDGIREGLKIFGNIKVPGVCRKNVLINAPGDGGVVVKSLDDIQSTIPLENYFEVTPNTECDLSVRLDMFIIFLGFVMEYYY
jgi:hypothetical protein